jgi:HSP20 family molecular chaperone IbpA
MFKRKKCGKCGSKMQKDFDFCPFCGSHIRGNFNKNWGMLGKKDVNEIENMFEFPVGISKLFNNLMKNLGSTLNELDVENSQNKKQPKSDKVGGISISISTSGNAPPKIKINSFGDYKQNKKIQASEKLPAIEIVSRNLKEFSRLPKKEPATNVRRFSDRIIYEIIIPGVKDLKDISIAKVENGIEIRAVSEKQAYEKTIPISLPIIRKDFSEGRLVIELDAKD